MWKSDPDFLILAFTMYIHIQHAILHHLFLNQEYLRILEMFLKWKYLQNGGGWDQYMWGCVVQMLFYASMVVK